MTSNSQPETPRPHNPARVAVMRLEGAFRVTAREAIGAGEVILPFRGVRVQEPTRTTLQLSRSQHLDVPPGLTWEQILDDYPWRFLNHSCEANGALRDRELVAVHPIRSGEQITFDYNTTEYDMSTPFACCCGARGCEGQPVRGFRHLSRAEQESLRPRLAAYLRRALEADDPEGC